MLKIKKFSLFFICFLLASCNSYMVYKYDVNGASSDGFTFYLFDDEKGLLEMFYLGYDYDNNVLDKDIFITEEKSIFYQKKHNKTDGIVSIGRKKDTIINHLSLKLNDTSYTKNLFLFEKQFTGLFSISNYIKLQLYSGKFKNVVVDKSETSRFAGIEKKIISIQAIPDVDSASFDYENGVIYYDVLEDNGVVTRLLIPHLYAGYDDYLYLHINCTSFKKMRGSKKRIKKRLMW